VHRLAGCWWARGTPPRACGGPSAYYTLKAPPRPRSAGVDKSRPSGRAPADAAALPVLRAAFLISCPGRGPPPLTPRAVFLLYRNRPVGRPTRGRSAALGALAPGETPLRVRGKLEKKIVSKVIDLLAAWPLVLVRRSQGGSW